MTASATRTCHTCGETRLVAEFRDADDVHRGGRRPRRKAGDDRAEQIAQAIERDRWIGEADREHAARIAREPR